MTTDEALRVVGHLLEHHPTQGAWARNKMGVALPYATHPGAVCWCLSGAIQLVGLGFLHGSFDLHLAAFKRLESESLLHVAWDKRDPEWRAWAVERLKTAGLP
jgi:hypothetical protein